MDLISKPPSKSKTNRRDKGASAMFLQNGSALLKAFLAATNGSYGIPLRMFTSDELEKATNNFSNVIYGARISSLFCGSFQERDISVRMFYKFTTSPSDIVYNIHDGAIKDIVTTSRMSHHKNVLSISGCCLEYEYPAVVYEYAGTKRLKRILFDEPEPRLSWRDRLKIASEIGNVMAYLHTAFATPIIYRILNTSNIIIDQHGMAKLFDFSWSISLPPGKLQVQDDVIGISGYMDLEYSVTGIVTQKVDVYSYGVLLLVLLTGKESICRDDDDEPVHIAHYVNHFIRRNEFTGIVDPKILEEIGSKEQEEQLRGFLNLALICAHDRGSSRPDMLDAAKGIQQIRRFFERA
ncbi:transmembrane signal receptor [Lithospermum erythrorhizon]|uniref:Transmembrane signal receptor n=1 Tax=Lithospermum erythrorhizon TaxID=34254 RepID=A0AAV3RAZ4_LITER